jgi:ribonucleoside-diphosphate reductase beta chain
MIAFSAIKGIFFAGSFGAIFWLKKQGLIPGLSFSNELISQDKRLHCNFACLLYSKLVNCPPKSCIVEIISSLVNIEMEYVVDALPIELIGCATILNSMPTSYISPSDANITTKSEICLDGWKGLVYKERPTSLRNASENTSNQEGVD